MLIGGYNKLTLKDFPGYIASICFVAGCPLRCPYCHNKSLVEPYKYLNKDDVVSVEFIIEHLMKRKDILEGVVISGGEPLMQEDIREFILDIRKLGFKIKLDTNGMYPEKLEALLREKIIDYVAIDYKNSKKMLLATMGLHSEKKSFEMYKKWRKSLEVIIENNIDFELRTTVTKELHTPFVLEDMAEELDEVGGDFTWYLQEFTDERGILTEEITLSAYNNNEMEEIKNNLAKYIKDVKLRS